jgi:hypothetical protein
LLETVLAQSETEMMENEEEDEREEDEEQAAALDTAVFGLYVVMLKQKVMFKVYTNPLLHFAAVLGISDRTGG